MNHLIYADTIKAHYLKNWNVEPSIFYFDKGSIHELPYNFRILEFAPSKDRLFWTYSTCCMSQEEDMEGLELFLLSSKKDEKLIELLTAIAHYHRTGIPLALQHTVNFGQPWQDESQCTFGLISLPYIDGPNLENMYFKNRIVKFYWLIPITKNELDLKKNKGVDALEEAFEEKSFNYLDPKRKSVV